MTPFNWNAAYVGQNNIVAETLWGTELPRLVINEAAVRAESPATAVVKINNVNTTVATQYAEKIWVELHNPVTTPIVAGAPAQITASQASLVAGMSYSGGAPLWVNNNNTGNVNRAVYQLVISAPNASLRLSPMPPVQRMQPTRPMPRLPNLPPRPVIIVYKLYHLQTAATDSMWPRTRPRTMWHTGQATTQDSSYLVRIRCLVRTI